MDTDVIEQIVVITFREEWAGHGRATSRMEGRTTEAAAGYLESTGFEYMSSGVWQRMDHDDRGLVTATVDVELV